MVKKESNTWRKLVLCQLDQSIGSVCTGVEFEEPPVCNPSLGPSINTLSHMKSRSLSVEVEIASSLFAAIIKCWSAVGTSRYPVAPRTGLPWQKAPSSSRGTFPSKGRGWGAQASCQMHWTDSKGNVPWVSGRFPDCKIPLGAVCTCLAILNLNLCRHLSEL